MLRPIRIQKYLNVISALGLPAPDVLRGSGIDETRLQDSRYLIDTAQCQAVIANVLRLSPDSGIALKFGYETKPLDHGVMGYAVMTCRSMRQTGELWTQYSESLVGVLSKLVMEEREDWVEMVIVRPTRADPLFIFCVEEQLAMFYQIGRTLTGTDPVVRRMTFSYPAPPYRHLYDEMFKCPIHFNAERTSVSISREWLDRPLQTNDEEFNRICTQHLGWTMQQMEHASPVVSQLRDLFRNDPRAIPSHDAVARLLGMSPRTLRRRLQDEGRSYQKLVDEFRGQLAKEYLRSTQMSPKQIAFHVGFNDISAFRRAFKSWTGQSVGEYRDTTMKGGST